jgi:diadenosine tetraphosphate (Ap4A) HIT family hydrolase
MPDGGVLCSTVAGSAPADRVYEDESAVAIMDAHPAATGTCW